MAKLRVDHNQLNPERSLLVLSELINTTEHLARGGIFLVDGKPRYLHPKLRLLRDHRPGREHLVHPVLMRLTRHWQSIPESVSTRESFGDGKWEAAQMLYHQWSSGVRSGRLETEPPSAREIGQLQEAVERDWPDRKIDVKSCTFEYPTGFVAASGSREHRIRLGSHVTVDVDGVGNVVQLSKAVTIVVERTACVTYLFGSWFKDSGRDTQTLCRLVKPVSSPQLPVALGAAGEQVMVVHQCKRACRLPATDSHNPGSCVHQCRIVECCPAHSDTDCKDDLCRKEPWQKQWLHCERGTHWTVFDKRTGFRPRSEPLPLTGAQDDVM